MSNTAQIEHQAESHRAHISQLVEELRARATPGEVLDQFLGWDDGREIARHLGRQLRDNPLPLSLVGAGVAWLMVSDAIRSRRPVTRETGISAGTTASQRDESGRSGADAAEQAAGRIKETAQSASDWTKDTAASVADGAQSVITNARQSVSAGAAGVTGSASAAWEKTSDIAHNTADAVRQGGSGLNNLAREQPLLVAGVGLALGMALGAILPVSETENQLFGEQAEALRGKASDLAGEGYEKARAVVQRGYEAAADAATDEIKKQGIATEPQQETASTADGQSRAEPNRPDGENNGSGYGSSAHPHH